MKRIPIVVGAFLILFGAISSVYSIDYQNPHLPADNSVLIAAVQASDVVFHGNVTSRIFHAPSCRYYTCKNCTAVFNSRDEAIKAGYRPCKVCNS